MSCRWGKKVRPWWDKSLLILVKHFLKVRFIFSWLDNSEVFYSSSTNLHWAIIDLALASSAIGSTLALMRCKWIPNWNVDHHSQQLADRNTYLIIILSSTMKLESQVVSRLFVKSPRLMCSCKKQWQSISQGALTHSFASYRCTWRHSWILQWVMPLRSQSHSVAGGVFVARAAFSDGNL